MIAAAAMPRRHEDVCQPRHRHQHPEGGGLARLEAPVRQGPVPGPVHPRVHVPLQELIERQRATGGQGRAQEDVKQPHEIEVPGSAEVVPDERRQHDHQDDAGLRQGQEVRHAAARPGQGQRSVPRDCRGAWSRHRLRPDQHAPGGRPLRAEGPPAPELEREGHRAAEEERAHGPVEDRQRDDGELPARHADAREADGEGADAEEELE